MRNIIRTGAGLVAFLFSLGGLNEGVAEDATVEAYRAGTAETIRGSGRWTVDRAAGNRASGNSKSWTIAALRSGDGELRGRVSLAGVPGVEGANIEARLSGQGVVGKLLDDEGDVLATFEGAVTAAGASGTFVHVGGGSGAWTWDRPAKGDAIASPE